MINVMMSKKPETVNLLNSSLVSPLIILCSHILGSSSHRPSITPRSRPPNQRLGAQSRYLRGGEEEYPANISFHDALGPSEFFILCALLLPLTFELIGLYCYIQNSNLSDHDQRIGELETECERYFFLVQRRSHGMFYSTRFVRCRLRRSEDGLRDELDAVRADAYARENDFLERIRELEDAQWGSRGDELRMANTQVRLVSFLLFF